VSATEDDRGVVCPECGATVSRGGSCRDNFHALLALECDVLGGAGGVAHFYAVSSYVLQHPRSMDYTVESLDGLRTSVSDSLAGTVNVQGLRARAGEASKAAGNVTRREGDPVPEWRVSEWHMTVEDVLAGGTERYAERIEAWARSVIAALGPAASNGPAAT
jgi:hypothetical protein